jgi:hypothetical protein
LCFFFGGKYKGRSVLSPGSNIESQIYTKPKCPFNLPNFF